MVKSALRRPQVVAHRGASTEAPEHTLAAYRTALSVGADALECDVRLTADEHLVCVHDRKVNRVSDGRGLVSTLELARLEELDFGSWHHTHDPEEPDLDRNRVLTLRRLLELAAAHPRRVELAIEVKHPTRYAGLVERRLVELLDEFGWAHARGGAPSPVRVMSFSRLAVRRIHRLAPSLDTVFLMEPFSYRLRDGALPRGVSIAGPAISILRNRPEYVERLHRSGQRVHVWTVDEPSDVELCIRLGVDAIITNRPREVRAQVDLVDV
ncbi:glycerophosphodiester phosphodiesterase [Actinocrinis sp.]|uniref:glycerophosphodiester phosphodiesterase n=1 Tax=Actinocrinis sp. TaxID=1920516 RepID=UPI0039C8907D